MTTKQEPVEPPIPVLEVVSFLDESTVVLVGHRVEEIEEGDELYVLGIGFSYVPVANVPLIAPKAKVEATFPAGLYVIAKTPLEGVEIDVGLNAIRKAIEGVRTVERRRRLTSKEESFLGDPGVGPVKIGDKVIRAKDLPVYVKYRAAGGQ